MLAILAAVLRLYARRINKLSCESNDYLILLGLVRARRRNFQQSLNWIFTLGGVIHGNYDAGAIQRFCWAKLSS